LAFVLEFYVPFVLARLEYEQNRDMGSRIKELESSISALKNDLVQVKEREDQAKSTAEDATVEINRYKEEVQGTVLVPRVTI
jgi:structural maintenance of chromosome 1